MVKTKKTVMAFGTFDLVHKGHRSFLLQAKKLGDRLVVSVARDINVKKIKGAKAWHTEQERVKHVKALKIADKVILGDKTDYIKHIVKVAPDIIALGYDQHAYTKTLRQDLRTHGLKTKIVRLKPHRSHIYKSSLIKARMLR